VSDALKPSRHCTRGVRVGVGRSGTSIRSSACTSDTSVSNLQPQRVDRVRSPRADPSPPSARSNSQPQGRSGTGNRRQATSLHVLDAAELAVADHVPQHPARGRGNGTRSCTARPHPQPSPRSRDRPPRPRRMANGLSQSTALPAASGARTCGACRTEASAPLTRSTSGVDQRVHGGLVARGDDVGHLAAVPSPRHLRDHPLAEPRPMTATFMRLRPPPSITDARRRAQPHGPGPPICAWLSCGYDLRPSLTAPGHAPAGPPDPRLAFHSPNTSGASSRTGRWKRRSPACGPTDRERESTVPTPTCRRAGTRRREPCTRTGAHDPDAIAPAPRSRSSIRRADRTGVPTDVRRRRRAEHHDRREEHRGAQYRPCCSG